MKQLLLMFLFSFFIVFNFSFAKNIKKKKVHNYKKSEKIVKGQKSKKRKRRHVGNGPDLKKITTESSYTEQPENGKNIIENN